MRKHNDDISRIVYGVQCAQLCMVQNSLLCSLCSYLGLFSTAALPPDCEGEGDHPDLDPNL